MKTYVEFQFFIFFRPWRSSNLNASQIEDYLNIPSDSDISGINKDSNIDQTYTLPGEAKLSLDSSDSENEEAVEASAEVKDLALCNCLSDITIAFVIKYL